MAECHFASQFGRMALREFNDSVGRAWTVWSTYPAEAASADSSALGRFMEGLPKDVGAQPLGVRSTYAAGWLTFKTGSETRRLAPIPEDWESTSEDGLRRYLGKSDTIVPVVRKHGTRLPGGD